MDPVDHTKTKQVLFGLSRQSVRMGNLVIITQLVQKQGFIGSDEIPKKIGSIVANCLDFNNILIDRMSYGS